jgi:hypothetical protein
MPARHPRPESPGQEKRDEELSVHIFSVSAGLVGVCLTVIGLFRVIFRIKAVNSFADNILAVDALGFLLSCALAYLALRSPDSARRRRFGVLADRIFLTSLGLMAIVGALIAYELV